MSVGYKDSPLGKIPIDWEVLSTDKIGEITSSKRIHSADYTQTGIPFFRGKEITQLAKGERLNDIVFIKTETFNELKNKFGAPKTDDILITAVGTIGSVYLVNENDQFYFKDGNLMWIRNIIDKLNKRYLMHYLRSNVFQNLIDVVSSGSSQKALTIVKFKSLFIPVPQEEEQQKIAEILSTVDAKIEVIDQQITETQALKKGLMQRLLTKGIGHTEFKDSALGKIPKSWEVVELYELRDKNDRYGFTGGPFGSDLKSEHYTDSGVKIIQLQNIGEGKFIDKGLAFTSEEKANELHSCNIFPGEIILAKMAPVARCCLVPSTDERYVMCSDGIRLSVNREKYDNQFVFQALNSKYFRDEAEAKSTGTTRARIGLKELKQIPVLIPKDIKEQKSIATVLSTVDDKLEVLSEKKTHYQELKQGLMQQLLTGKIRLNLKNN